MKISCPFCNENNPENLVIINEGYLLKCDTCGRLFNLDTISFQGNDDYLGKPEEEPLLNL
jgi:transcription elongation factor Elf1